MVLPGLILLTGQPQALINNRHNLVYSFKVVWISVLRIMIIHKCYAHYHHIVIISISGHCFRYFTITWNVNEPSVFSLFVRTIYLCTLVTKSLYDMIKMCLCSNNQCTHIALAVFLHSPGAITGNRLHSQTTVLLQGVSWGGHIKFSLFSPLCSCLLTLKGDAAKFKPCYSWTKRHVRANLVRNWISAQRGSHGSQSINFLSSGTDYLFYCSSMTVWNVFGFHIWTAFKK